VKRVRCEASGLLPVLHRACACKGMQHKPPRKGVPPLPKGVPAVQFLSYPSLPLLPSIPSSALPFFSSFLTFPAHPSLRPHLSCFRHTASCTFRGSAEYTPSTSVHMVMCEACGQHRGAHGNDTQQWHKRLGERQEGV
jgi:hypothetical protein